MRRYVLAIVFLSVAAAAFFAVPRLIVGRQKDGTYIVATGQRIEPGTIAFGGRPIDLALHPSGAFAAVVNQKSAFLVDRTSVLPGSEVGLDNGASLRGCAWTPDGTRFFVSVSSGYVQEMKLEGKKLVKGRQIALREKGQKNPVPSGMCVSNDGSMLYVCQVDLGTVAEVNLDSFKVVRQLPVEKLPFDVRLTPDGKRLVVSNWGGEEPDEDDETAETGGIAVVVDRRGIVSTGSVSIIDIGSGRRKDIKTGLHPAGIAISGNKAYIANAASDSISEIDLTTQSVVRTIPIKWGPLNLFGSMPNTLAVRGSKLYSCNGGDNAICEVDLTTGKVLGFRPAGFFPVSVALSPDGAVAFAVNTKGNGSVRQTNLGKPGNAHNFEGTVSVVDLHADIVKATNRVAEFNGWNRTKQTLKPDLNVYKGSIKHVLYIIKENRTYDEVFGDVPEGNGDPSLCGLGEETTPNHHALAREFTLFDNAYVCGTNSAEGHQWAVEGLANDYIERFYAGYTRSYPYDGGDAMAYSSGGFIWDAALKKNKSIRIYGEFCRDSLAKIEPKPKSWLETWEARKRGEKKYNVTAFTTVASIKKHIHPRSIGWPLLMSDQWRADEFIEEYTLLSAKDKVPNLMVLALPADHTEGTSPEYPKPKSMVADNDLALGRIVEAVSHSPQWKDTCIFVMEDDAQAGPDHVDGHRTVCLVISPYTRRNYVDSTLYTQISILRSIELMLGLDAMTKFDALANPFAACFTQKPDIRPYNARPNLIPLDDMNPPKDTLTGRDLFFAEKSLNLDWSDVDKADWYWLNRIIWHSLHDGKPYPFD
jgi:YVTN family beta-propeller protein